VVENWLAGGETKGRRKSKESGDNQATSQPRSQTQSNLVKPTGLGDYD
jgi:hypothetical protein